MPKQRTYIAIDLKSFYASVECVQRNLDPLTTNLVVADINHTDKTICLAVTPSLKAYGISGRARLYEVKSQVGEINRKRTSVLRNSDRYKKLNIKKLAPGMYDDTVIQRDPTYSLDFMIAPPQMAKYIEISSQIYNVYLDYFAPEDIHVYSIDEVFIDVTGYLTMYNCSAHELTMRVIKDVLSKTGITATAGIGTNLYLAKIAMDIDAKKMQPDADGVRISELDEMSYRARLWDHKPITDFWRIGPGYQRRLAMLDLYTMGDIARFSLTYEDELYEMFGVNAELLIDHAWGWEPVDIKTIKSYKPVNNSLGRGQVLHEPYNYEKGRIVIAEMIELLVMEMIEKGLVTNHIVMTIGYDISNVKKLNSQYEGKTANDHYGRLVPYHSRGTTRLKQFSDSTRVISEATIKLYDKICNRDLLIRRFNISAGQVVPKDSIELEPEYIQMDIFTDYDKLVQQQTQHQQYLIKEERRQKAILDIQKKFGKNALLKGTSLKEGATTIERNQQIGGHKA